MKKNLKIVSAAAAALLAVAPVVATGVAAHADVITDAGQIGNQANGVNANISADGIVLNARHIRRGVRNNSISGSITATVNGQSVTANLDGSANAIVSVKGAGWTHFYDLKAASTRIHAGEQYEVNLGKVTINVGKENANKTFHVQLPKNIWIKSSTGTSAVNAAGSSFDARVDQNGYIELNQLVVNGVYAYDLTNPATVFFAEKDAGSSQNVVTSGSVDLTANNGLLNVGAVLRAAEHKYGAYQMQRRSDPRSSFTTTYVPLDEDATQKSLTDALKALNITPDAAGFFTAPKSFTFNLVANSHLNRASKTLPVTVNVPNGKETSNPSEYDHTVRVWNKKASYIYNASHVRQGNNIMYKIGSGHNVVAENGQPKVYHVGGIDAYKLADGHYKGNYVDVRNFSTSRVNSNVKIVTTRSRVFTNTGRVVGRHNYVNSGVRVKVSGTKTIKGHKMYRIATNRYIKAANVRNA